MATAEKRVAVKAKKPAAQTAVEGSSAPEPEPAGVSTTSVGSIFVWRVDILTRLVRVGAGQEHS